MGAETEVLGLREARAEAFVCLVSPCSPFSCVVVPRNEGRKLVPTCMGLNLSSLLLQEDLSGLKIKQHQQQQRPRKSPVRLERKAEAGLPFVN